MTESNNYLCKYRHVFGVEGEGFHSVRLFDIAVLDVIGSIIIAMIISSVMKWSLIYSIIFIFLLSILLHIIFCVNTTVVKFIKKIFTNDK
jgi:hypothetical protein